MSKTIKIAAMGLAALGIAGAPALGAIAADNIELTDTLALTIQDNCAFTRASEGAHTGSTWTGDAFAATVVNNETYNEIAKSKFTVVCNNVKGYSVTVAPTGFTTTQIQNADAFGYSKGDYAASGSSWYIGGMDNADSAIVKSENTSTANTTFEVTYNVKVSDKQQAATYNASAVYTFAQTK